MVPAHRHFPSKEAVCRAGADKGTIRNKQALSKQILAN
ncbi:mCG1050965 [Mus musculus]|nr:mCG1050965 [Mus musculus]